MKILSVFLFCAIAQRQVAAGIALTSLGYQPPNNGHSAGTIGTGTLRSDCTYRGSDRREECILVKSPALEDSIRTL